MSETERVINDLNTAKLILCNPQMLTPEMCVRIGQTINSVIDLLTNTCRDIETLVIRNIVPNHLVHDEIEFMKMDMANKIARKLVAEGFVEFFSSENECGPITDATEIEARIRVVKPTQERR